jgi:uncharacterized coiled-coil protein SlyX
MLCTYQCEILRALNEAANEKQKLIEKQREIIEVLEGLIRLKEIERGKAQINRIYQN